MSKTDALMRAAFALHQAGSLPQAEALYQEILRHQPHHHDALYLLGLIEHARGNAALAMDLISSAIREHSGDPAFHLSLGDILYQQGRLPEAAGQYERALVLDPTGTAPMLANLAAIYRSQGRIEASLAKFRQALALAPTEADIFSSYLFTLNLSTAVAPDEAFAEHRRYDRLFPPAARLAEDPDPDRNLRLGYISPDFNHHAVSYFIEPVLAHHDPARFEVSCYYLQSREDEVTARLKALSPHWVECAAYSDAELAARIEADRIDILVDLAGHTAGNRLPVLARKPAPVQATWLGYLHSSGLSAMNFRLTDGYADPPGDSECFHSEALVRLPDCQWCYRHPGATPPVSRLPALAAGNIRFGSFNKFQKLSGALLEVWATLLHRIPGAELLFIGVPLDEHARLAEFFAQRGIPATRLEMQDRMSLRQFREAHQHVDIALDSHPYSGATTTCDSLWMGVPTLTLTGASSLSRSSASLLQVLGLSEWIARTPEEIAGLAARHAADLPALATLRAGLRQRMEDSALMDAARFTRNMEHAYRGMWLSHLSSTRTGAPRRTPAS
jgi:tetratricopeptide (TPR) repeat protein